MAHRAELSGERPRLVKGRMSRVRLEAYPLVAERTRLQAFCDDWFNQLIPPEVGVFRPALPLVFCTVLHHDEIGDDLLWRTGTLSQNELYFLVLLDRYRLERGELQFVEHCATTPYIFVDNALSAVIGRERFGLPKQDCRFHLPPEPGAPVDAPRGLSVSTWQPSAAGRRLRPLLELMRAPLHHAALPIDQVVGAPLPPARAPLSQVGLLWLVRALAGELRARSSPGPLGEWRGQLAEILELLRGGGVGLSLYNLRQFAHPFERLGALYQDLVRMRLTIQGVHGFSPLVHEHVVNLHRTEVLPIADRLGLTAFSRSRQHDAEGRRAVEQFPAMFPFRSQGDVELSDAHRLCWRLQGGAWHADDGTPLTPPPPSNWAPYNDHLGPSAGAFLEPQPRPAPTTLDARFLMLAARRDVVARHLRSLLPAACDAVIEPIGVGDMTAVRIVATRSRPRTTGEQEELLWLDGSYLSVAVPVTYRRGQLTLRGMLLVTDFTDNGFHLQALRELAAAPTHAGEFSTAGGDWFSDTQDVRPLLQLRATAVERTASETTLTTSPVLDIYSADRPPRPLEQPETLTPLVEDLWTMLRALQPVFSMGSISAPQDPTRAVYRRLTLTEVIAAELVTERAPDPTRELFVRFHHSETFPLVEQLGLITLPEDHALSQSLRQTAPGRVDVVPVVAVAHHALRVRLGLMEILWQDQGDTGPMAGTIDEVAPVTGP